MRRASTLRKGRGLTYFLLGASSALVLGGGVAVAAIPSTSTGKITGCVNKQTALARIIDYQAGKRCLRKERPVVWNQRGLRGTQGPAGAPGATGAQGAIGPTGASGQPGAQGPAGTPATATFVDRTLIAPTNTFDGEGSVSCPEGKQVINGFILPRHTAGYFLGEERVEPASNTFVVHYSGNSIGPDVPTSLTVRLVCLG